MCVSVVFYGPFLVLTCVLERTLNVRKRGCVGLQESIVFGLIIPGGNLGEVVGIVKVLIAVCEILLPLWQRCCAH